MVGVKVSVVIPTYKRPHFLTRAVESVLGQTYENLEVVVVDDNMPDSAERAGTAEIMKAYSGDSRVKYICNSKSLGGGLARNEGIKAAEGEYIAFLDDDDKFLPDKIKAQLDFMVNNKLEMSFTDLYLYDGSDKLIEYRRFSYVTDCSNKELLRQHILHSLAPTVTVMARRDVLLGIGGFLDVSMGQDFMLMWRLIESGTKIGYLPGTQVVAYLHDGERISVGQNKIDGENRLYELKQTKFELLTQSEQRYVRFRHFAVLSVVCKRSGKLCDAIKYGAKAVTTSPAFFVKEIFSRARNRLQVN